MSEDLLRYDLLIENALRDVVRQTLEAVVKNGLPGEHHFYITFQTRAPGVELPESLLKKFPQEMTIVLQHQFFGLKVDDTGFCVILSFNGVREKLAIPYKAITTFADPSVNFALQFQAPVAEEDVAVYPEEGGKSEGGKPAEEKRGEVISLDMFRKK